MARYIDLENPMVYVGGYTPDGHTVFHVPSNAPTADEEKIATDFCMKNGLVMVTMGSWETLLAYYQRGTGL